MTLGTCGHDVWPLEAKRCTFLAQRSTLELNVTLEGHDVTL
jgi:hypothetical protein